MMVLHTRKTARSVFLAIALVTSAALATGCTTGAGESETASDTVMVPESSANLGAQPVVLEREAPFVAPPKRVYTALDAIQLYLNTEGLTDLVFGIQPSADGLHIVIPRPLPDSVLRTISTISADADVPLTWGSSGGLTQDEYTHITDEFIASIQERGEQPDFDRMGPRQDGVTIELGVFDLDSDPAYYEGLRQELEAALQPSTLTVGIVRTGPGDGGRLERPIDGHPALGTWVSTTPDEEYSLTLSKRGLGNGKGECGGVGFRWGLDGDRVEFTVSVMLGVGCLKGNDFAIPHHGEFAGKTLTVYSATNDVIDILEKS